MNFSSTEVKAEVNKIIEESMQYFTKDILSQIYGFIDLTSLNTSDTNDVIREKLIDKVNNFESSHAAIPNVAGICVYPKFASLVHNEVMVPSVKTVVVGANFPSSQTYLSVKVAELELIAQKGADEIDIVLPLAEFLSEKYDDVIKEIRILKEVIEDKHLKVILETGAYSKDFQKIYLASMLAMEAGADFIKTSTGKIAISATPEAVYVMAIAIKDFYTQTNKKIGLKPAGGISDSATALKYYAIVKSVLGDSWLTPKYFRIGASSLAENLLSDINN